MIRYIMTVVIIKRAIVADQGSSRKEVWLGGVSETLNKMGRLLLQKILTLKERKLRPRLSISVKLLISHHHRFSHGRSNPSEPPT